MSKEDRTVTLSGVAVKESVLRAAVATLDKEIQHYDLKVGDYFAHQPVGGNVYWQIDGAQYTTDIYTPQCVMATGQVLRVSRHQPCYRRTSFTDTGD